MRATDLLKKQHREVKSLFKKLESTDNARMRRQLMSEISRNLEAHTTIEEEIFYPAVQRLESRKAEEMVFEAYEEHHVVKLVLAEMPRVNPEDERFEAKMTVLSELVEHHVEEEEKEMFKLAQKLGKDELAELGEQMEERFEAVRGKAAEAAENATAPRPMSVRVRSRLCRSATRSSAVTTDTTGRMRPSATSSAARATSQREA